MKKLLYCLFMLSAFARPMDIFERTYPPRIRPIFYPKDHFNSMNNSAPPEVSYEDYKQEVEHRIQQGLRGDELIKPFRTIRTSILKRCALKGYQDLIEQLVVYDSSLKNSRAFHDLLLCLSIDMSHNKIKLAQWLIDNGVDVNIQDEGTKKTLLHYDKYRRQSAELAFAKLLLINNANPNIQDNCGMSSLYRLASRNPSTLDLLRKDTTTVRLLIVGGCNISIKTYGNLGATSEHNNKTATEIARMKKNSQLAACIEQTAQWRDSFFERIARGEDIDVNDPHNKVSWQYARTINGDNALSIAVQHDNIAFAGKLIKLFPELINQSNFDGKTVLDQHPQKSVLLLLNMHNN